LLRRLSYGALAKFNQEHPAISKQQRRHGRIQRCDNRDFRGDGDGREQRIPIIGNGVPDLC